MRNVLSIAAAALAGAVLVGGAVAVQTTPAEAGASTGTWKYGAPYRGYRGYRGGGYGYRYGGGAVAAGVATGLALGAVGAAAATPYYGYPTYGAAPVYGGDCVAYGLVASGFADLVIEAGLKFYDYAAVVPVLEGAGGGISDWQGHPLGLQSDGRVVAWGDARIHAQALKLLA